jgi:hypothetical protein
MLDYRVFRANITSQNGEDGIIREILDRLNILEGWCVEFGAWDGKHLSNTWNLWHNLGWSAVLIEGESQRAKNLQVSTSEFSNVFCLCSYVSHVGKNKLNNILKSTNIPYDFDILSIDVDGDDWHIWNAFTEYQPKVVICEFSMWFPAHVSVVSEPGNENLACSALSLLELGISKGYELVCCNNVNAIFVRSDLVKKLNLEGTSKERLVLTHDRFDSMYLSPKIFEKITSLYRKYGYFEEIEHLATEWLEKSIANFGYSSEIQIICKSIIIQSPKLKLSYLVLADFFRSVNFIEKSERAKKILDLYN